MRARSGLAALLLVLGACGGGADGAADDQPPTSAVTTSSSAPATTTPSTTPEVTTTVAVERTTTTPTTEPEPSGVVVRDECTGVGPVPEEPVLTWVADGRLAQLGPDEATCLVDLGAGSELLAWGPTGDRVLTSGGRVDTVAGTVRPPDAAGYGSAGFSAPTGTRILHLDGEVLRKSDVESPDVLDISFLERLDLATYHPDGSHILGVGVSLQPETEERVDGIFVADNEGANPRSLVFGGGATIHELVVAADGTRVSFLAEHDGTHHLHSLDLVASTTPIDDGIRRLGGAGEDLLPTLVDRPGGLGHLVLDPADPARAMLSGGDCATGATEVLLVDQDAGGYPIPVAPGLAGVPVGFLDETTVAVLARDGCDGLGELWTVELDGAGRTLVATDVEVAAVRRPAVPLAYTLVDVEIAGFT